MSDGLGSRCSTGGNLPAFTSSASIGASPNFLGNAAWSTMIVGPSSFPISLAPSFPPAPLGGAARDNPGSAPAAAKVPVPIIASRRKLRLGYRLRLFDIGPSDRDDGRGEPRSSAYRTGSIREISKTGRGPKIRTSLRYSCKQYSGHDAEQLALWYVPNGALSDWLKLARSPLWFDVQSRQVSVPGRLRLDDAPINTPQFSKCCRPSTATFRGAVRRPWFRSMATLTMRTPSVLAQTAFVRSNLDGADAVVVASRALKAPDIPIVAASVVQSESAAARPIDGTKRDPDTNATRRPLGAAGRTSDRRAVSKQ